MRDISDLTDAELAACVAREVMEWVIFEPKRSPPEWAEPSEATRGKTGTVRALVHDWLPDWSTAGEVVEWMQAQGWFVGLWNLPDGRCTCCMLRDRESGEHEPSTAATAPRAIFEAALAAVRAKT